MMMFYCTHFLLLAARGLNFKQAMGFASRTRKNAFRLITPTKTK